MTFISIERYYILKYPIRVKILNTNKIIISVLTSISLGLFWSLAPLLGWSKYSLEDSQTCCSVEWKERSLNVTSYNVLVFIFVFVIPFGLILVSNFQSIIIVYIYLKLILKCYNIINIIKFFKKKRSETEEDVF